VKSSIFASEVPVVQWIEFQIPVLTMWVRPSPATQRTLKTALSQVESAVFFFYDYFFPDKYYSVSSVILEILCKPIRKNRGNFVCLPYSIIINNKLNYE